MFTQDSKESVFVKVSFLHRMLRKDTFVFKRDAEESCVCESLCLTGH